MHRCHRQGAIAAQAGTGLNGEIGRCRYRAVNKEVSAVFNRCGACIGAIAGEIGVAGSGAVLGIADRERTVAADRARQFCAYTIAIDGVCPVGVGWCCQDQAGVVGAWLVDDKGSAG